MEFNLTNADWNQLKIDDKSYSFKCFFDEASLELLICDIRQFKLYILKQDREEVFKIFKDLNPCLEAPMSKILSLLKESLCKKDSTAVFTLNPLFDIENVLKLQMKTKIVGVNFYYKFDLNLLDSGPVKDYFVVPLLYSISEYQAREIELIKIIQSKDKELDDFKSQGVKLTRGYLKTDVFNADSFNESTISKNESKTVLIENPDSVLHTDLSRIIHTACMKKYYSTLKESNDSMVLAKTQMENADVKNSSFTSEPDDFVVKSSDKNANKSNEESDRLKMLETKLNEEKIKNKNRTPKKKKLF